MSDWQPPEPDERRDSVPPEPESTGSTDSPADWAPPETANGAPTHAAATYGELTTGVTTEGEPTEGEPPPDEWLRLDPRMLVVGPVSALRQFAIPALFALVGLSSSQGGFTWWMLPLILVGVLAAGLIPWFTTRYRWTDSQFQRRSGLVSKKQLTAPLDRVRSVDIEASLLHRLLGLAKVKIGTGVDDTQIELDSLGREQALELQRSLLARARRSTVASAAAAANGSDAPSLTDAQQPGGPDSPSLLADPDPQSEEVLATINLSWARFAPLNLARLAVVAAAVGFLAQFIGDDIPLVTEDRARDAYDQVRSIAVPLLAIVLFLGGLAAWVVLAVVGYVLQWWGMRLTRNENTVRLTSGLLTTRSTSVEEQRIRGVSLSQPALMRLFRGAELSTLATGVGSGGVSSVMPPSPLAENERVGGLLLGSDEPMHTALVEHGPAARRRLHLRRQWWTLTLTAAAVALVWYFERPWWWAAGAALTLVLSNLALAESAYRLLGHALTPAHLVSREGALTSTRTVLERDGIIGWVVTQNLFQRRVGLVTLTATTAAGSERVVIRDVPQHLAIGVAVEATPSTVSDFLAADPR